MITTGGPCLFFTHQRGLKATILRETGRGDVGLITGCSRSDPHKEPPVGMEKMFAITENQGFPNFYKS